MKKEEKTIIREVVKLIIGIGVKGKTTISDCPLTIYADCNWVSDTSVDTVIYRLSGPIVSKCILKIYESRVLIEKDVEKYFKCLYPQVQEFKKRIIDVCDSIDKLCPEGKGKSAYFDEILAKAEDRIEKDCLSVS